MIGHRLLLSKIQRSHAQRSRFWRSLGLYIAAHVMAAFLLPTVAQAGPRDIAYTIYNRITGVPPDQATLDQLEALIAGGKGFEAAMVAIEDPYFYNLTLKSWLTPWTNEDEDPRRVLNDFTATMIGMIRDDLPFDQALYGDIVYVANPGLQNIPPYSLENNDHYEELETQNLDLKANLSQEAQSNVSGVTDIAGVMSTRAFGEAYYFDGTNRAALRFTLKNFLCSDLEQLSDTTTPDYRIRQDVDRSPGGDSTLFRNQCAGCHGGMDALAGAFASFDFVDGALVHEPGTVQPKMIRNATTFPNGYRTEDNGWINLWAQGQNAAMGWPEMTEGEGVNSLGRMLAGSKAFSSCMSQRVFKKVCLRTASSKEDKMIVQQMADGFAADNRFNMKELFANTAVACLAN